MKTRTNDEPQPRIPRFRFIVVAVLWVTAIFLFFDRVNISMAAPFIMEDLGLSGVQMGFILSMFSWGYIFGHVSGGVAADKLNIRRWCTTMFSFWCVATFLTGICRSVFQFTLVRAVFGFCEGGFVNPMNKLQNHWVFPSERGFVNGSLSCAAYLGLVIGMPLVGWLIAVWGWSMMFYISGVVSVIGVVLFYLVVYDYPKDHPWISDTEKHAIESSLARDRVTYDSDSGSQKSLSFTEALKILLRNWVFWAICGAFFFIHAIYITNFSWLPGYLMLERGFSGMTSGMALVLPYLAAAVGALSGGTLSDRFRTRSGVIMTAAALTLPSIGALLVLDGQVSVIIALSLILFFNAAAVNVFVVMLFDLFPPEIIGVSLGLMAGLGGGLSGVVGPMIMGLSYDLSGSFLWGFVTLAIGLLISISLLAMIFVYERRVRRLKARNISSAAMA